jgi:hypothetical protein
MPQTSGSLLLGLDGVVVESVHVDVDRTRIIHVLTADDWVGVCPGCTARSSRSKGWVITRPRDIKIGPDIPRIMWRKRKWLCTNTSCKRKSFTESTPSVPPRARVTVRAKREMALAVLDDDRSVKAVGAAHGCSWNTCHAAVIATADPALAAEPEGVTVLGIDETRRGKAKWETCSKTGVRRWVDRWDTGLVDITGAGGLLVQVNGRAAKPVTDWLDKREEAWKANIEFVAIDMSVTYAKAAREALPHAQLIVDRFHLVKRANEMVDEVRPPHHRSPPFTTRTKERPGVDQPAPAAARRRTIDRRAAHEVVREADLRGPERRHRRRLDREGTPSGCVGLHRAWRFALRNHRGAVRVLCVLRRMLGARDRQARRNHLSLAGADDSRHPDRAVQRSQ